MTARQKSLTAAARRSIAALRKTGALSPGDEIKAANLIYTAGELDAMHPAVSPAMRASMTRAHLAATRALFDEQPATSDDATSELLAYLQSPAMLGDATGAFGPVIPDQVPPWMK
jgi:hypothetical protein